MYFYQTNISHITFALYSMLKEESFGPWNDRIDFAHCIRSFFFRFQIDNTDHIIDVNRHRNERNPHEYDQINIICPTYNRNHISNENDTEQFIVYHVTKEEYDACQILHSRPRIIAQCMHPFQKLFFTISFRSFSPTPGALEFKPGFDYHFISTSSNKNVNQLEYGMCHTNNMKIVFKVAKNPAKQQTHAINSFDEKSKVVISKKSNLVVSGFFGLEFWRVRIVQRTYQTLQMASLLNDIT